MSKNKGTQITANFQWKLVPPPFLFFAIGYSKMYSILVATTFFVPWLATMLDPYFGFVISTVLCAMHFGSKRFHGYVQLINKNSDTLIKTCDSNSPTT